MSLQRYARYFQQLKTSPPRLVWAKVRRHLKTRSRRTIERLRLRWQGPDFSTDILTRSLTPQFATVDSFLAHIAIRREPCFFIDPAHRAAYTEALRQICPEAESLTIAAAERTCGHIFDLLGSGPTYLGQSIDWHTDFKTGRRFDPTAYYADIKFAPYPGGYDIKLPWELSRCQHFVWLGQAYWFTENEQYAREFIAQTLDWIAHNPPLLGVNWTSTMDVAIRAVNWLWGYHFFQTSPSLDDAFRLAFFKSLLVHGRHIFNNLEYSETHTNNHYLANLVGLVYLGLLLPELKEAARWRDFGLSELERELFKQVYADGVNFEASTAYHRLATEMFLSTALLARLNGHNFGPAFMQRLERMLEFVMHLAKPDGAAPLFGDNDNGRLHRLQVWPDPLREWVDYRYLLAIGSGLFERDDFARAAGDQYLEAIWFFGPEVLCRQSSQAVPAVDSRAFPEAGIYVMRHEDLYLAVDAGAVGQNGNGGHAHNDVFSFELFAHGRTWLVDPGTYTYTADYAARNELRSTAVHNTVMVDGAEQNRYDERRLFRLQNDARPRVLNWHSTPACDVLSAEHYGYKRLSQPVTHQRIFYFDKSAGFWWLEDLLHTTGSHHYDWFFSLWPGMDVALLETGVLLAQAGKALLLTAWVANDMAWPEFQLNNARLAPGYGHCQAYQILKFTQPVNGSFMMGWLLYPLPEPVALPALSDLEELKDHARTEIVRLTA